MNRPFLMLQRLALALFVVTPFLKLQAAASGPFTWENAIIQIEVTSKAYNYIQPWERSEKKVYKSGVVVEGHQIITTADGLADSADAWVGGLGDRERTLAIMKDPRSGPMGVTAVVLVLLLKFAALASLPLADTAIWLAPMLARTAITAAFLLAVVAGSFAAVILARWVRCRAVDRFCPLMRLLTGERPARSARGA